MPNTFPFYEAEPFWLKRTYGSGGSGDEGGSGGIELGRRIGIFTAGSIEDELNTGISDAYVMIDGRPLSFGEVIEAKAGLTLLCDPNTIGVYDVYAITYNNEYHITSSRKLGDGSLPIEYVIPELPEGESLLFVSSIFRAM